MVAIQFPISRTSYFGEPSLNQWVIDNEFIAVAFKDNGIVRLDIYRKDDQDGITWDELQAIKNACGFADKDAIEFYPAERDVLNSGNVRHLYVSGERLPLVRRNNHG